MPRAPIHNLESYGLTLQALKRLSSSVPVRLRVDVRYPDVRSVFDLSPSERGLRIVEKVNRWTQQVLKAWAGERPEVVNGVVKGILTGRQVIRLARLPAVSRIWIDGVGRRRKRAEPKHFEWYAVRARFAIQIEGQTSGMQDYEVRILLVKAWNNDDAIARLRKEFGGYGEPYLNPSKRMVRWKFEEVLDVKDLPGVDIDATGTEVFWEIRSRRMKPQYEWHPRRRSKP